jgi:hypothetical protein
MRLEILNHGYRPATKLLFAIIKLMSRQPVPDAAKLVFYRPDFYGTRAKEFTHEAMRGPSAWSRRCWPTWNQPRSRSRSGPRCGCSAS